MHDRFVTFLGADKADQLFMASNPAGNGLQQQLADGLAAEWGSLPPGIAPRAVRALRLFDPTAEHKTIPSSIYDLSKLDFLGVPAHLLGVIDPAALPPSVRTLWVETEGTASIPRTSVFPHVERLLSASFRMPTLQFESRSFPALRHLHVRLDRKEKMLTVIPEIRQLVELSIGPVSNGRIFEPLRGLDLQYLILWRGTLPRWDRQVALAHRCSRSATDEAERHPRPAEASWPA
jgi:hypothetical protein